ncbi:hypothetical protein SLEP1_g18498 [Rubroshorea leprosula]|uniref:Uncharacterized protein n=1 Tax=Rubroshorea leprosula TaxID=152421 RepID=A0AAV5J3I3_9ROSI|nr:hypothetical protein SLEP1_g18498 [Rubroshorea leprosula]
MNSRTPTCANSQLIQKKITHHQFNSPVFLGNQSVPSV